jgi:hypothetical protein
MVAAVRSNGVAPIVAAEIENAKDRVEARVAVRLRRMVAAMPRLHNPLMGGKNQVVGVTVSGAASDRMHRANAVK